jgi:hypothetical protein
MPGGYRNSLIENELPIPNGINNAVRVSVLRNLTIYRREIIF